jgi:hypothetical protein
MKQLQPNQNQSNQDKINSPTANNHTEQTIQTDSIQLKRSTVSVIQSPSKLTNKKSKECQPTTHQIKSNQPNERWNGQPTSTNSNQ